MLHRTYFLEQEGRHLIEQHLKMSPLPLEQFPREIRDQIYTYVMAGPTGKVTLIPWVSDASSWNFERAIYSQDMHNKCICLKIKHLSKSSLISWKAAPISWLRTLIRRQWRLLGHYPFSEYVNKCRGNARKSSGGTTGYEFDQRPNCASISILSRTPMGHI